MIKVCMCVCVCVCVCVCIYIYIYISVSEIYPKSAVWRKYLMQSAFLSNHHRITSPLQYPGSSIVLRLNYCHIRNWIVTVTQNAFMIYLCRMFVIKKMAYIYIYIHMYICTVRERTVFCCLLSYFICLYMRIQISPHRYGSKNVLQ